MTDSFRTHPIYYLLIAISLGLTGLLGWSLRTEYSAGSLFFTLITLAATLWFALALKTEVVLTESGLLIYSPFRYNWQQRTWDATDGQLITYRQLIEVDESGRFLSVLTLLYHPIQVIHAERDLSTTAESITMVAGARVRPDLLDLEGIESVTLPLLTNQRLLRERLESAILQ